MAEYKFIKASRIIGTPERAALFINNDREEKNATFKTGDDFSLTPSNTTAFLKQTHGGWFEFTQSKGTVNRAHLRSVTRAFINSRSGKINQLFDLETFFDQEALLILGKKLEIKVNLENIPLSPEIDTANLASQSFFFVEVKYHKDGEEKVVFNILANQGNKFILDEKSIFHNIERDQVTLDPFITLMYQRAPNEPGNSPTQTRIDKFIPIFPNEEELLGELKEMKNELNDDEFEKMAFTYLEAMYGATVEDNVKLWLSEHVFITS